MSEVEGTPREMNFTVADAEGFKDCHRQFVEERRLWMQSASSRFDKLIRLNENRASFYEKLILLDGGTIALSLTLLGGFISRTPAIHLPRQSFLYLACPAWVLLLISIQGCWATIAQFNSANYFLIEQFYTFSNNYHAQLMAIQVDKLSGLVPGLSALASSVRKTGSEETAKYDALVKEAAEMYRKADLYTGIATLPTTVAFILLCIFAVKMLLSV